MIVFITIEIILAILAMSFFVIGINNKQINKLQREIEEIKKQLNTTNR